MTRADKILILVIIILAVISLGFIEKQVFSNEDKFVSIQIDGKEVKKIIFDPKIIGKTIEIESEYGYNLIEIADEKVRVIEADCKDQIDVKQGYISKIGETIVCLPNKMIVEIKGLAKEESIDIMTH